MQPNNQFIEFTKKILGVDSVQVDEVVQELWSGYGQILRLNTGHERHSHVIAKYIHPNRVAKAHPRGWDSDRSNQRKIHSYKVEKNWFEQFASQCGSLARVPSCLGIDVSDDNEVWILLEDLDIAGFPKRSRSLSFSKMKPCIQWLAGFHARFMGVEPKGLWETGTYWHLETRPDELEMLEDKALKQAAAWIDAQLNVCQYQTLVHGDAKVANFCFSLTDDSVAAVDFQYVGGGCGMKDLAYFVGSCLDEGSCEALEEEVLDYYFTALGEALSVLQSSYMIADVEAAWRPLYRFAWADFHRFLKGWSPGHWKINTYSERVVREILALQI